VAVPVPLLLAALKLTLKGLPVVVVGVPVIAPVVVLTDNPAGNPAALKLVGLLLAVIVYENGVPTIPLAVLLLVITGAA
jgi:hypothetical protein